MIMSRSEEVQTKVLNALYWDLAVPPHRVKVEVENGWVTISSWIWSCARRNGPSRGISQCEASVGPIDNLTTPRACVPVADTAFRYREPVRRGPRG